MARVIVEIEDRPDLNRGLKISARFDPVPKRADHTCAQLFAMAILSEAEKEGLCVSVKITEKQFAALTGTSKN